MDRRQRAPVEIHHLRLIHKELDGVLEYLEDPTPGIEGLAAVRRQVGMPLATNMCVVSFADVAPAVAAGCALPSKPADRAMAAEAMVSKCARRPDWLGLL